MEDYFAVLSLAHLHADKCMLTFGGAGDGMLVIGRDGLLKHAVESSGIPMGIQADTLYASPTQLKLEPGVVLLLLTDGFREAQNEKDEVFGVARIIDSVGASLCGSASQIFEAVLQATRRFVGEQRQQGCLRLSLIRRGQFPFLAIADSVFRSKPSRSSHPGWAENRETIVARSSSQANQRCNG